MDENGEEIDLKQNFDDDNDIIPQPSAEEAADYGMTYAADEGLEDDYTNDTVSDDYDDYDSDSGFDEDEISGFSTKEEDSPEDLI